ncbi:ABC transporter ATP-binding protein/permease [Azovibrio restrictus]|uniref:ABCB family ABC transporter ATP-binding protein/permease n=1 Tax=Azovibrio restrictus TaxID=146938 RepID=UPI0026ED2770|nr:ABC transporter ATP-binding protein/permease [Azovibrio restrictus]
MRSASRPLLPAVPDGVEPALWPTLRRLLPYLWAWRVRVVAALLCLVGAKLATVAVPLVFKAVIDGLDPRQALLTLPLGLLLLYGLLRFAAALFTELREILFARVTQETIRHLALTVFRHLHALSLRFHLERQTGGISRDIERGSRAIASLINYSLYSILPTLIEIGLVLAVLVSRYDPVFALITLASLFAYVLFTVAVSNWRIQIRRRVNETDSAANTRAIDSLINYETVKYFNNEAYEARRYDADLSRWAEAATRSQTTLSFLNLGQQAIIAFGVTLLMWQAARQVTEGRMTVGDLVLVNAFLVQLYMPLNFLGVVYREIRQALIDIERMFALLGEGKEVEDAPDARPLARGPMHIRFEAVRFAYDPRRPILDGLDFSIPAGQTVAVVGPSGAGKSTLARLLFRFYDVQAGAIRINGTDIRQLTQASLRAAIGIVPQDTVLFNDSLYYNVAYGRPDASRAEVEAAARAAQLDALIARLPEGWNTQVGERGLKLSGGEKQRVAIARALLKQPDILIFDEATSALDSRTEQAIQAQIEAAARGRTALVIAHRLSTVMGADTILVMEAGRIVEQGRHRDLLAKGGVYAQMWAAQQQESQPC